MLSVFLVSLSVLLGRLLMLLCYEFFVFSVILSRGRCSSLPSSLLSLVFILIQIGQVTLPTDVLLPASVFF